MSILNVTNLTNNPEKWIEEKFLDAFEQVEKDLSIENKISDSEKFDFIDNEINFLEEQMEEAQGKELLGIIDNYLVNYDFYSYVEEFYQNR